MHDSVILDEIHLFLQLAISFTYVTIGLQFWRRFRTRSSNRSFHGPLAIIFILCGIMEGLGYFFHGGVAVEITYILLMIPLLGVSLWFIFRQEILNVSETIEADENRINTVIEKYKTREKK